MSRFVHLHTHSHYSLLEALPKIPELVERAKELEMPALALTDSGNLYGAIEFYKECIDNGVKPIIGVDAYMASRTRFDKEARIDNQRSRLVLLAMNDVGYKNLLKLISASYLEGFYYKPRMDREIIEKWNDGLIAILPSFANVNLEEHIEWYKKVFGTERFYLEITHHPEIAGHEEKMRERIEVARKTNTPLVAAHDVYYLDKADRPARETLLSIQSHMGLGRPRGFDEEEDDFTFITEKQAEKLFKDTPDALENIEKIVSMCDLKLELGKWVFPKIDIAAGRTPEEELREMVRAGYELRGIEETPEINERVEYELSVIEKKGFSPYFLVVGDLLRYARENKILTNIRGSVAGSMVTYLAGITSVNPLDYNLPFERFLNPDRPSAPDIDMDYADNRRDEMIDYARGKYGAEHVAQIGTFGTMMARGAVRDVTRAMGFPVDLGDKIAKLIPMGAQGFPMTIERAKKENPDFNKLYKGDPDVKRVVDMAEKIEGNARHISVHAAGVVIAPSALTDYTALQYDTKGEKKVITQYDMYSIEEAGLLKFDFLGLKNLSIIADAIERIKKIEGIEIDIDKIPLDDKKTFDMLARGETEGTFQLNGDAMTKFLVDLKPSVIHDINAMVALYRPGPMQFIPLFIERKHKPELVTYLDPALKPILEKTYGVLVYQDDLLMIAKDIAGYTWGELDKFRKAVGKKIPEEMRAQKEKFIKGVVEYSKWPQRKAEELWTWIEPFAAYGFNKAHSVSYGRVAYQTAWLKANYPEIYMSAVLTADSGDVESIGVMVAECKRMGIDVLAPSVNESYSQFTVPPRGNPTDRYKIRFGLTTIKNFGQGVATSIIEERKRAGKFKSLIDFLERVTDKNLNRKSLESLIKSGALDEFGERGQMLANIDTLLGYHKEQQKHGGGLSLFDMSTMPALKLAPAEPATQKDKLTWEKELLGLYISGHPLDAYREKLSSKDTNISKLSSYRENADCVIGGIVSEVRDILTKKNERMAFVKLEDLSGDIDVVVFPKVYEEFKQLIQPESCIAMKGKVSKRNGETSFIAEKIKAL
jgi:DNA polymerase III subunit alpha